MKNFLQTIMSILGGLFKKNSGAKKENAPQKTVIVPESGQNPAKSGQEPSKVEKEGVKPDKTEVNDMNEENKAWDKIRKIINIWETGKPEGNPAGVYEYFDGPGDRKQLTYSFGMIEYGSLKDCLKLYIKKGGKYSSDFVRYIDYIGDLNKPSLAGDGRFVDLLKRAAKDPIMIDCQNEIFQKFYLERAKKFIKDNGFELPISWLVLVDSYIHSGSVPGFLRRRFAEVPPAKGGDEMAWVNAYLRVRRAWLANHSRKILQNTVYRCDNMISHIAKKDLWLRDKFYANGVWVQ